MTDKERTRISKTLSLALRHEPGRIGLRLDSAGWAAVDELIEGMNSGGFSITVEQLEEVVRTNDKQRFAFSEDKRRIRANQGHSIAVDLMYAQQQPPELLYHGTAVRFLPSIREQGLRKMQRHHVHLSAETAVTLKVGARRGRPVLLTILAGDMARAEHVFYVSANGVWLVDHVPVEFIEFGT
jgi:putative RNA 2'-phosphotransferase